MPSISKHIPSHLKSEKDQSDFSPLLDWNLTTSTETTEEAFSHYISIRTNQSDESSVRTSQSAEGSDAIKPGSVRDCDWSPPVRLTATEKGTKLTVAVPTPDCDLHTRPVCVTGFFRQGLHYYVIREHESPSCLIHNHTQVPLCYGHQNPSLVTAGMYPTSHWSSV